MKLNYSFDALRGNLDSRSNTAFGTTWSESFSYDSQDRLTDFNDNNGSRSQGYDGRGRITANSRLGTYNYSGNSYQQTGLASLTAYALYHYQNDYEQLITYNAFKSPVKITETGKEIIDFQYNGDEGRSHMYYGSTDADKFNRPFRRHYSEDGSVEITEDIPNGKTSFVFYLGGDAYDAPAIWKYETRGAGTTDAIYYLHRDHLGSINLITDNSGNVVEKRQFDAWGNLVKLQDGSGTDLANFVILDRGYTGHEHLLGVGLINLNARLYDPLLHRFLEPDNYVQDPGSSQGFNRYGYVGNNPLSRVDQSGEFWNLVIGGLIGGTVNWLTHGAQFNAKGWGYFGVGAAAGALGAGIGKAVTSYISIGGFAGGATVGLATGSAAGFVSGAGNAWVSGKNFGEGIFAGIRSGIAGGISGGIISGAIAGIDAISSDADFWNGHVDEVGGYAGSNGTYLDESIPPGSKPTATGEIARTNKNPDYGKYGKFRDGGTKAHFGIDYSGNEGDDVFAMYDGKVIQIGGSKFYGENFVRTSSVINNRTYNVDYGHMSRHLVELKQMVKASDLVGKMGRLGNLAGTTFPTHVQLLYGDLLECFKDLSCLVGNNIIRIYESHFFISFSFFSLFLICSLQISD